MSRQYESFFALLLLFSEKHVINVPRQVKRFDALRSADGKRRVMTNEWNRRGFVGTTAAVAEAAVMARSLSAGGTGEHQRTGVNTAPGLRKALPVHALHPPTWRNAHVSVGQLPGSQLADPTTYLSGGEIKKYRHPAASPTGVRRVGAWGAKPYGMPDPATWFAMVGTAIHRHDILEPRGIAPYDVTSADDLTDRPGTTGSAVRNEGAIGPLPSLPRSSRRSVPEYASVVVLCPEQLAEQHTPALTTAPRSEQPDDEQALPTLLVTVRQITDSPKSPVPKDQP